MLPDDIFSAECRRNDGETVDAYVVSGKDDGEIIRDYIEVSYQYTRRFLGAPGRIDVWDDYRDQDF